MKIILLDLNATYVENTNVHVLPHTYNIQAERYRSWLTELLKPHYVIMLTARPERHKLETLEHILQLENWLPSEAYFNPEGIRAPEAKDMMLGTHVYPKYGQHIIGGNSYMALESNAATRAMYSRHGIPAYTQQQLQATPHILSNLGLL